MSSNSIIESNQTIWIKSAGVQQECGNNVALAKQDVQEKVYMPVAILADGKAQKIQCPSSILRLTVAHGDQVELASRDVVVVQSEQNLLESSKLELSKQKRLQKVVENQIQSLETISHEQTMHPGPIQDESERGCCLWLALCLEFMWK